MINNQEAFNKVVIGLRNQGCKSMVNGNCLYRGPNNIKCGAGHLIPDNLYKEKFECKAITSLVGDFGEEAIFGDTVECIDFIQHLQEIHDECEIADWEKNWEKISIKYNLVIPQKNAAV